jgi:hypothetical protein
MEIDQSDFVFSILVTMASQLPLLLVWLVGMIMAIVRWGRHPRVSAFVLIAVFAAAATSFGGQIVFRMLPHFSDSANLSWLFPLVSGCMSILYAACWACMLFAAFAAREPRSGSSPFVQQYGQPPQQPPIDKSAR